MHGSITSCFGHLENTDSLSYTDLPNADVFRYAAYKTTLPSILSDLIREVFGIGIWHSRWQVRLPHCPLKAQIVTIVFPGSDRLPLLGY